MSFQWRRISPPSLEIRVKGELCVGPAEDGCLIGARLPAITLDPPPKYFQSTNTTQGESSVHGHFTGTLESSQVRALI